MKKIFSIFAAVLFAGSLMAADNLGPKTIKEFLDAKNTTDTCVLTGVVSNIVNTTYGNFDLTDETGSVYVYGLLTPAGENKKFATLGVEAGDTLTMKAVYSEFNSKAQAKNAVFVSVKKGVAPATPSFDSFEALVAADLADGTVAEVTFADVKIDSIYTSSKGVRKGLYLPIMDKTGAKAIELYYSNGDVAFPAEWVAGGTISGTVLGKWTVYNSQWELVPTAADWTWAQLTYKAAATAIDNTAVEAKAVKTIENGMVIINYNGKRFNVLGQTIR